MKCVALAMALVACGDNRKRPADAQLVPHEASVPGLPYVEVPPIPASNQSSEVLVAAAGANVVVVTTAQDYPSANSFEPPADEDDPAHPFRRIVYMTSRDTGHAFDPPQLLDPKGHTDPLIAAGGDGSFWAGAMLASGTELGVDLYHSNDAGRTFQHVADVAIEDKPWLIVDDTRRAVWIGGLRTEFLVGFDGTVGATDACGQQMAAGYADAAGAHFMNANSFTGYLWDGIAPCAPDGQSLPSGDSPGAITFVAISMGRTADGSQWSVRAMKDSTLGGPIVVRVRHLPDEGHDLTITPPGALGFLPTAALDTSGRLHVAWYDSSGALGKVFYSHSMTSDLQGEWSEPIVVDGDACPGDGWYPSDKFEPEGARRLREYIGIATTGSRSILAWTHAPEAPSRVRVAYVDD